MKVELLPLVRSSDPQIQFCMDEEVRDPGDWNRTAGVPEQRKLPRA
jgi:hypothetical protein